MNDSDKLEELEKCVDTINRLGASVMINMFFDSPAHDAYIAPLNPDLGWIEGNTGDGGWDGKATLESARKQFNEPPESIQAYLKRRMRDKK